MREISLLFRKDLRRFWPEVLATLTACAIFAVVYPWVWTPHDAIPLAIPLLPLIENSRDVVPGLSVAVLALTWLVLIGRVIHGESLVGDRQYWVTRPIDWQSLLAEKLLFLGLFLALPLLLANAALLHAASFRLLPWMPLLLLNVALNVGFFFLPLIALATVTRNFFRLSLTILGICAVGALFAVMLDDGTPSVSIPYIDHLSPLLFFVTCVVVILVQYSSRTVWLARWFLVISCVVILLVGANPFETRMLEAYYPPAPPSLLPVHLAFSADPSRTPSVGIPEKHLVQITLPLEVSQVPYGYEVSPEDVKLTLEAPDGDRWQGSWQAVYNHVYTEGTELATIEVKVDQTFFERVRKQPLHARLSLALKVWEYGKPLRLTVPADGPISVPGMGLCAVDRELSRTPGLACRWALRQASYMRISAPWTTEACSANGSSREATAWLNARPGTSNPDLVDLGVTPVWVSSVAFTYSANLDTELHDLPAVRLCPGSLLTVTPLTVVRRARYELDLPSLKLPPRPATTLFQKLAPAD